MKKNKKPTVTIGIPALNEEQNIEFLLRSLVRQRVKSAKISSIIIISDASTDKTVSKIKRVKSSLVKIIENRKRKGKAHCLNMVMKRISDDIFVFIDADILIKDKDFTEKLIRPIVSGKADLTSGKVEEIEPDNLLEKILETSMKIKKEIFESINMGNNVYTCHGRSRAFSRRFYKSFSVKLGVASPEDAYSYLYAKSHDFRYAFVKEAKIYYKLPGNLTDHQKQSLRFLQSKNHLAKEFTREFIESEYRLPKGIVFKSFLKGFLAHPLMTCLYIMLLAGMEIKSLSTDFSTPKWEIAESSKVLIKSS